MGVAVLVLVVVWSYAQWRIDLTTLIVRLGQRLRKDWWPSLLELLSRRGSAGRGQQREPSLVAASEFRTATPHTEPGDAPAGAGASGQQAPAGTDGVRATLSLDSQAGLGPLKIDYWARIHGEQLVTRNAALAVFRQHEIDLDHSHAIHGRTEPGNAWLDLREASVDEVFTDLIVSIQLADGNGPVDESELTRFNNLVYTLAETLGRRFQFDCSVEEALPQAARLEQFCQEFDLLVVINVVPAGSNTFAGPNLSRVMGRAGMRLGEQDVFHFFNSRTGVSRFSLANLDGSGGFGYDALDRGSFIGLTLMMNVPRVERPGATFLELLSVAEYVAAELGGSLVDPDGVPLAAAQYARIKHQVRNIESAMTRYGVVPGSDEARRLF